MEPIIAEEYVVLIRYHPHFEMETY
jgi:hypothetical protein